MDAWVSATSSGHCISCCHLVKETTFKIWDGIKGVFVDMTDMMLIEARTDPGVHPGCIEEGIDLVLRILTNHVGLLCLTQKRKSCRLTKLCRTRIKNACPVTPVDMVNLCPPKVRHCVVLVQAI